MCLSVLISCSIVCMRKSNLFILHPHHSYTQANSKIKTLSVMVHCIILTISEAAYACGT